MAEKLAAPNCAEVRTCCRPAKPLAHFVLTGLCADPSIIFNMPSAVHKRALAALLVVLGTSTVILYVAVTVVRAALIAMLTDRGREDYEADRPCELSESLDPETWDTEDESDATWWPAAVAHISYT